MILSAGQLLGFSPPEIPTDLAWFRYLLVLLAVAWAVAVARARPVVGLLAGCVFVTIAAGFWVLAMARPYGLLEDPAATRRAAEIGVRASAGGGEGFLAATPGPAGPWAGLAAAGVPPAVLILAPTVLPLVVMPLLAALIHWRWAAPRRHAALGAVLWLAFSTGDLDALRGLGVLSGMWAHPMAALGLVASAAAVFTAFRAFRLRAAWIAVGALIAAGWWLLSAADGRLALASAVLALTLDQGLWLPLAALGMARHADPAARALTLAGAIVVLAAALPLGRPDPWGGHALYRLGLILAASGLVAEMGSAVGDRIARRVRTGSIPPARVGVAALLLAFLPGSFLTWWDPSRLDASVAGSIPPLRPGIVEAMDWIRRETPADAVVLASPQHAPVVAALAGRRVLRAPTLAQTADDGDRRQAEGRLLYGNVNNRLARRYGVSHVVIAPGDFGEYWLGVEALETRGPFRLVHRGRDFVSVYEVGR